MINWKVRFKNKAFWLGFIPAILLLVQQVCAVFGIAIDTSMLSSQLLNIIETVFLILASVGVVVDPTTKSLGDSERALGYEEPN